ncbi:diguanylate cyclase [Desulfurivibrio dismutans]|uniref:diguanylate cyclase n=1 Tax=Desulfurivibrio dismutans TaxID=1398908 RepID=UPI0023DADF47|nr:diguanylate cyclase [Desulfurivibrio alkaliphilus]MDF1615606.1 diguanylate cyclase [Desulfurivibrio alkaliphilus]
MCIKQPRILVVDDEVTNIELLAEVFSDDYEVLFATGGAKALELAAQARPELILLDVVMPGMDGFEVCSRLKAERITADIPVIFVTGIGDQQAEVRGLELGAADYVTKPINPPVVRVRVRNQIELKQARDQLVRLAVTDGLTGLANRRHFDEALQREYARQMRAGGDLSLLLLDIDCFKLYNDNYGHLKGDDCLRELARVLTATFSRATDLPARYGGEEFACIMPDTDAAGALQMAHRIRQAVADLRISHGHSPVAPYITVSIGAATGPCHHQQSALHLIARADEQLYRAKEAGRNRVCQDAAGDDASASPTDC